MFKVVDMYVRVRFDSENKEAAEKFSYQLCSIPNGTCLVRIVLGRDTVERFGANTVLVFDVDLTDSIRNRVNSLLWAARQPGVKSVTILSFDEVEPEVGTPEWDGFRERFLECVGRD